MNKFSETRLIVPQLGRIYQIAGPWALSLLRFLAGFSMAMHGWVHINADMNDTAAYFEGEGFVPGLFWAWAVTLTEFVGGICLAIGLATRLVAIPIFIFLLTAVSYHSKNGFYWDRGGLEYPLMWAAVVLVFLVHGGGKASADQLIGRSL